MSDNITPIAWGHPLTEAKTEVVQGIKALTIPNLVMSKEASGREAIARLKKMMAQLEVDINYFNTFKGQGMAVNKFGVMKFDLNEIVAMLEK